MFETIMTICLTLIVIAGTAMVLALAVMMIGAVWSLLSTR